MYRWDEEEKRQQEAQAAQNGGSINRSYSPFTQDELNAIYAMGAKSRQEMAADAAKGKQTATEKAQQAKIEAPIRAGVGAAGNAIGEEFGAGKAGGYVTGGYDLWKALTNKEASKKDRVLQGAQGVGNIAGAAGVPGAGYVASGIGGVKIATSNASPDAKAKATVRLGEDVAANAATGGLYGIGQVADQALLKGRLNKLRGKYEDIKDSKIGMAVAPGMWASDKLRGMVLEKGFGLFGSGKSKDQQQRDAVRKILKESGFLGDPKAEDWNLENPDGTSFDIGKDGGARLDGDRRYFDVDTEKQGQAIGTVNPLAYILTGGNEKLATEFAGYFTNTVTQGEAATNPELVRVNALDKYKRAGFDTPEKAMASIDDLLKAGKIDAEKAKAFKLGIQSVFSAKPPQQAGPQSQQKQPQKPQSKGRRKGRTYTLSSYTPQVYAPTTTAPLGSPSQYGDAFAQSLANIYANNQGV